MNDGIRHLLEYATKQRAIGREATSAELHSIAEVIDCEMRSLKDERDHWMELAHQWEEGASTRRFAERLEAAAAERAEVTLFGVDYTPLELVKEYLANCCMTLPLDADGEPWHINDEFEVDEGIAHVNGIGDNRLYYIDNDGMQWTRADNKRHHHAPTVEDVLREFASEVWNRYCNGTTASDSGIRELEAEYAEKLRLAGEDA